MASEWKALPLESCMSAIIDYRGKTPTKTTFGVPLVTAKIVKGGRIQAAEEFIAESDYEPWMRRGMPKKGDVVMTTEAPLGEVAQLDGQKVALAQRVITLRGKQGLLENGYLRYLLQSTPVQDELRARATGTTVLGIKQSELRKVRLVLPPLPEQKRIAHILGTLDDKIELNRRMNATLEAMAQALFQSWFVDFDPVRRNMESGVQRPEDSLFPDSFEDSATGEIPTGWEAMPLYETATYRNGAPFKPADFCQSGDGLPIVKIAELKSGLSEQTKWSNKQLGSDQMINTGDLLYSWSGSPDTSLDAFLWSNGPGLLNQHIFKVITPSDAEKRFVYYLLKHLRPILVETARDKQTTGLGHVTVADMKRLHVCRPPKDVLVAFDRLIAPIFDKAFANTVESQTLASLRDTLLPKLLSGEIQTLNQGGRSE